MRSDAAQRGHAVRFAASSASERCGNTSESNLHYGGIGEFLLQAAQRHSQSGVCLLSPATDGEGKRLTYPELLDEARRILGGLQRHHARAGAKVALVLDRHGDFIPAFWACILGGYIPCAAAPIRNDADRWAKQVSQVDALLDHPVFVTSRALKQELPAMSLALELEELRAATAARGITEARGDTPALIMLTSGSTGHSKAVVHTHATVSAAMASKAERRPVTAADVVLNWVSFDHVTALLESHMIALYVGATQIHVDAAAVLADPLLLLRLIDRHRVSVTLIPNFLLGQINAALRSAAPNACAGQPLAFDLSCMRHIITGGEANVVETSRRFLELLAPCGLARTVLWPGFGMTETCAGLVYSSEFPDIDAEREFASVGFPIRGVEMRIVDEHGARLPAGETGELQLRGPMIFSHYHNDEEATRAAFTPDGWLRTGDLGRIEEGRLNLVGRSKDCIIVSGVNYFSQELEATLERLEGIERSYVAAFPTRPRGADTEQLVVAFAPSFATDDEGRLHQVTVAIRNTTVLLWGFRPALILPLPRTAFPKTSLGKIQRSLLRKRLEARELAGHEAYIGEVILRQLGGYVAPENEAERVIAGMYAELFALDPAAVSARASFFDLGGTSLDIIKLTRRLTQQFGRAVEITTILQSPAVRALAAWVAPGKQQGNSDYDPIVPLQSSGTKTPLFCIHPASGEVLVFVSLASYFVNERPFLALRARGFNEGEPFFTSFEEMVHTYVAAIRRRQPHGPYALAGYSFGGPVAFEIAKVLESQGAQVAFVASIDMPPRLPYAFDLIDIAVGFALFLSLIDKQQFRELPAQIRAAGEDPYARLVQLARPERLAQLDLDVPKFRAWTDLTYSLVTTILAYEPSGTAGSMTVFCADPLWSTAAGWLAELRQWDQFTRRPNRYIQVEGEHHTLLEPRYVAGFQAVLRAEIQRALGD